jgi:hypothetical protein
MLNFLSSGSKGLAEMRVEADKLGITFSRLDARRVEEANDAIDRMKMSFGGLKQELIIGTAPALNITATAFTNMIAALRRGDVLEGLDLLNALADVSGLSGIDREIGKLQLEGLHGPELFELKSEAEKLKALEEEAKLREHANELIKEAVSPAKQFADLEKRITDLAESGIINWDQYMALYEEGVAKLKASEPKIQEPKKLEAEKPSVLSAGRALLAGSAEAFSASLPREQPTKELKELVKVNKQTLKSTDEIVARLKPFPIGI